jgi:tetratricopeptide (TPR) repeat protein
MNKELRSACLLLLFLTFLSASPARAQKSAPNDEATRDLRHQAPEWMMVKPHLPDPVTASAEKLEMAGDVLRARRFPEDALEYYNFALQKGGKNKDTAVMNKLGVTELEMRNTVAARIYFQQVVRLKRKDAQGWNNLGAVECLDGNYGRAISDYGRAIKLDKNPTKTSAAYHSNLGTAYMEVKDYASARKQYEVALQLDPEMYEHSGGTGLTARMLSPEDHARYCFEMARLYSKRGDEVEMMHYLTMASEGGFDVLSEMTSDNVLGRYRKDPRVLLLVRNAQALRSGRAIAEAKDGLPALPAHQQD